LDSRSEGVGLRSEGVDVSDSHGASNRSAIGVEVKKSLKSCYSSRTVSIVGLS
jgi:hypothetical protein